MKKLVLRVLLGAPLGIAMGQIITIVLSLIWGQGYYAPVVPEMARELGGVLPAVIVQTALCAVLGAVFAGASLVWQQECWGIAKQSGLYLLITLAGMLPIAYACYWMEHTLSGVLMYIVIFLVIFLAIWLASYLPGRRQLKEINREIKEKRRAE